MTKPFNVTLIRPDGYIHSLALKEAAEYLYAMLEACGHHASLSVNRILAEAHNVILCPHLLGTAEVESIPPDSIMFNSEQLDDAAGWHFESGNYADLLRRFCVWDYSHRNLAQINHLRKSLIPFLYCSRLTRTSIRRQQGRGLLFFGTPTDHRRQVLAEIAARGVRVEVMFGMYSEKRDRKMFDAWAVLNLHKADDLAVFEPIRCFYPLINNIPVISEEVSGDATADDFRDSMFFFERRDLADRIAAFYWDDDALARETAEQFRNFRLKSALPAMRSAVASYLRATSSI